MTPIDNSNLKNLDRDILTTGFVPNAEYTYDAEAEEVDVSVAATTYPAGTSLLRAHVHVHDQFGNQVTDNIDGNIEGGSGPDNSVTIDVSSLDVSKGLDLKVTILASDKKLVADGIAKDLKSAGSVGSWDTHKNA